MAVGSDGSIYPCYRFVGMPEYVLGNVGTNPSFDDLKQSDAWSKLMQFRDYVDENCKKCKLCENRKNIVFGTGNKTADIMFIGEGPGADEDIQGIPFVGKAGKLMDQALMGIGLKREEIYIANIVKCRPPANRDPEKDEIEQCIEYLKNQIELINPEKIVILGSVALKALLGEEYKITEEEYERVSNYMMLLGLENGFMQVPDTPGLGIESLNEELIEKFRKADCDEAWKDTSDWDKEWANDREWS